MIHQFAKAYLKLLKYSVFIGTIGGIASFISPNHHGLIKAMIGVVIDCMLLGNEKRSRDSPYPCQRTRPGFPRRIRSLSESENHT